MMPNAASPHLLSSPVPGGCPQAVGRALAYCLWDGLCVYQPWIQQLVMGLKELDGGEELAHVPAEWSPQTHRTLYPQFFHHAAATVSISDGGYRGIPSHHQHQLNSGLPTLGHPRTRQFCGISSGASEGGDVSGSSPRETFMLGESGRGEKKSVIHQRWEKGKSY